MEIKMEFVPICEIGLLQLAKIFRLAGTFGNVHWLLQTANRGKKLGFKLKKPLQNLIYATYNSFCSTLLENYIL